MKAFDLPSLIDITCTDSVASLSFSNVFLMRLSGAVFFYSVGEIYSDTFTNPRSILVDQGRQRFAFAAIGVDDADGFDPVVPGNDIDACM